MNNKFIRFLVIINGILIPIFIISILYNGFLKKENNINSEVEGVEIGEKLERAIRDTLALQGLSYETPIMSIYNSTNMYLPLSILSYQEAKDLREDVESAGDISEAFFKYFNIIFLDENYNVIGKLLDKKASILDIEINDRYYRDDQIDKTVKHIAYLIGFNDSNKDGKLNSQDDHDLYISDLSGKSLTQVTSNRNILDYQFIKSNSEIFIRFKDRNGIRDEHNMVKFGLYNIEKKLFTELKSIEETLRSIESQLIK